MRFFSIVQGLGIKPYLIGLRPYKKWSGKPGSNWRPQPWQGYVVPNYKSSVCTISIAYSSCIIFNFLLTVPTAYLRPIIKAPFLPASKPL